MSGYRGGVSDPPPHYIDLRDQEAAIDAIPDAVRQAALAAFAAEREGAPVADVEVDSVLAQGGADEPRGDRHVRFAAVEGVVVDLAFPKRTPGWVQVVLDPPGRYTVTVRQLDSKGHPQARAAAATDAWGRVTLAVRSRLLTSLVVDSRPRGAAPLLRTAWLPL